jgi:hypothetical protein
MSKKYDFSFDVSTLSDFTNENTGLIATALYSAPTIGSGIEILVGQKGDIKLNTLEHDLYLQSSSCGWTVSGDTTLDQVAVSVCSVDYKEALCPKTLEPKWYGQLMAKGSDPETFPFAQFVVDNKMELLKTEVDKMFWTADSTSGTGNAALCDGVASFLGDNTGSVYVAAASGTSTASIINAKVQALIDGVDERAYTKGDLTLYMSVANFKLYVQYLISANLYNYANNVAGKTLELTIPGHDIKVMGIGGLRGTTFMYLTPASNLVFVTDSLSDGDLDMWFSKDNDEIRMKGSFKFGVGVYFTDLLVHNNENV